MIQYHLGMALLTEPKVAPTTAAYIAGILDGEGHLGFYDQGPGRGRPRPVMEVGSIDHELIDWLHKKCGGFKPKPRPAEKNRREFYRWRIQGLGARNLARQCVSYMRITRKRKLAERMAEGKFS